MNQLHPSDRETLEPDPIVNSSRVVSWPELGATLVLVLAGGIPLILFWSYLSHQQTFNLQQSALLILLGIYAFAVVETFAIFLLWGYQRLVLPKSTVHWLGSAILGEISSLLLIVFHFVFQ